MTVAAEKAEATKAKASPKQTIVQRILAIAEEVGVLKPEKSGGVPFAFRGIDAVVATLTPLLIKYGVIIAPTDVSHILTQRDVGAKVVTKAEVEVTYTAYGADGDSLVFKVPGQADDFADRSTAQAMSVAFRILLLQMFHIAAFGNEEQASEDTKNAREAAGQSKLDTAKTKARPAPRTADPAEQMRQAILGAAATKGISTEELNEFGKKITGKDPDGWFNDPEQLNLILAAINK